MGPDVLVGLRAERSLELVVGILGILKAGGAYLPLDPAYPRDRVEFMLEDAGVQVVVAETRFADGSRGDGARRSSSSMRAGRGRARRRSPGSTPDAPRLRASTRRARPASPRACCHPRQRDAAVRRDRRAGSGSERTTCGRCSTRTPSTSRSGSCGARCCYGGRLVVVPVLGEPLARGVPRAARATRGHRAQPDALGVPPAASQADVSAGAAVKTALRYVIFGGEALELASLRAVVRAPRRRSSRSS